MGKKRKRPNKIRRLEKAAQHQEAQQHTDKKPNIQGNAEDGIEKNAENNTEKRVQENIEKIVEENVEKNVEVSTKPVIVFAHGAGAPSTCEWMQRWKVTLASATEAVEVITFDYPYFSGGKRGAPPKAEKLVDFHVEKVKEAAAKYPGHPVVLAGKSMGARVSCMVSAKGDVDIKAVLCLGYPLKGMDGSIRDGTLLELAIPTLFVQTEVGVTKCPRALTHPRCSLDPNAMVTSTRPKWECYYGHVSEDWVFQVIGLYSVA